MKIITVIGARPQFIKAAVVSKQFSINNIEEKIIHTGQHHDANMSDVFFEELNMNKPHYNLSINGGGHGKMTGKMLEGVEEILIQEKPDWLLVYGDTNSTLAGALAAAKLHIKVAHVEAGLRSFNKQMPEEINRILTDNVSNLLFAPTQTAVDHLLREGISKNIVHQIGDVMFDASMYFSSIADDKSTILKDLNLTNKGFVLCTIHRAENTDNISRLTNIVSALNEVSKNHTIVLPIHPRTRKILEASNLLTFSSGIILIDPIGYLDMVQLEKNAKLIVTDSGGVQKEAFFFSVPCVTLRDETEWVELIDGGWNMLCSPKLEKEKIVNLILEGMNLIGKKITPYGDGNASEKIVNILKLQ